MMKATRWCPALLPASALAAPASAQLDGTVTWFVSGIPAQLEVDEHDRVTRIIPWQFL